MLYVCGLAGVKTSLSCVALATRNEFVTSGAVFQFESPACEATMLTSPTAENDKFVPPMIRADPACTEKLTPKPLEEAAARPIRLVVS